MADQPEGGAAMESNPSEIGPGSWASAENAACDIIRKLQPNSDSEERRWEVVDYIQRLMRNCFGAEVFPYGSVPLKTYLPDGDIDLTAFGGSNVEDTLADDMKSILEEEEKIMAAEFVVKDVQLIRAEVKLVKCIVQNIVVDVSFNQVGGVSTLCFLEQVDRLIGKEHLFKRSIILIKAWCYYESRILGAHHGLISTYALETLVLYIFHLFHSTLDGPLAVLFKFLDYFSKFDWDSYCISLNGPICLSSLPAIVVEMPEGCHSNLLLSSDFLSMCVGMFSIHPKGGDRHSRGFQLKHLNIVDPLNETNNLGRSVSKGNFYRIRSAFSYGAKKLALILLQPETSMANELHKFFANTIARHGGGQRPDVYDYGPSPVRNRPISAFSIPESSLCKIDNLHVHRDEHAVANGGSQPSTTLPHDSRAETERRFDVETAKWQLDSNQLSEPAGPRFRGDANDLAISGLGNLTISIESPKSENCRVCMPCDAPHLYFPNSKFCNGGTKDEKTDSEKCERDSSSLVLSGSDEGRVLGNLYKDQLGEKEENMTPSTPNVSGERNHTDYETPDVSANSISDLTGNYDRYLQCLQYARWFCEHALDRLSLHMPPMSTSPYQRNSPRGSFFPMSPFKQNGIHNGLHPRLAMPGMQPVLLPGLAFGWEDGPKPRMGTYFPTTNQPPHGYRPSSMKGRKYAPSNSPRNNGRNMAFSEANSSSHEPSEHQVPVDKTVMVGSSDHPSSFVGSGYPSPNGLVIHQPEGVSQFESISEKTRQHKPVSSSPRTQNSQPTLGKEQDRISLRSSYRLKDEDDFPPLSV